MRFELLSMIFLAVSAYGYPTMMIARNTSEGAGIKMPKKINWSKHQWKAALPTDLRSPCPGLNTLANHGILPRDGRGLNVVKVLQAGLDGYNVQADVITLAAKVGQLATDAVDTFTLDDLKLHNSIEHDASVSRGDFALGDNHSFNETIFQTLVNSNPGVDYYNATSAGITQKLRLIEASAINPNITNTNKEFQIRTRESALYLSVMGGPTSCGEAPKKFVDVFFREERLPIAEGWTRSKDPITVPSLDDMSLTILKESQWVPDNKCASIDLVIGKDEIFQI